MISTGWGIEDPVGPLGAIMQRRGADPEVGGTVAGAVLTLGATDLDADAENNVFGVHQPDPEAR